MLLAVRGACLTGGALQGLRNQTWRFFPQVETQITIKSASKMNEHDWIDVGDNASESSSSNSSNSSWEKVEQDHACPVLQLLQDIGMEKYHGLFREAAVDTLGQCADMTVDDLEEIGVGNEEDKDLIFGVFKSLEAEDEDEEDSSMEYLGVDQVSEQSSGSWVVPSSAGSNVVGENWAQANVDSIRDAFSEQNMHVDDHYMEVDGHIIHQQIQPSFRNQSEMMDEEEDTVPFLPKDTFFFESCQPQNNGFNLPTAERDDGEEHTPSKELEQEGSDTSDLDMLRRLLTFVNMEHYFSLIVIDNGFDTFAKTTGLNHQKLLLMGIARFDEREILLDLLQGENGQAEKSFVAERPVVQQQRSYPRQNQVLGYFREDEVQPTNTDGDGSMDFVEDDDNDKEVQFAIENSIRNTSMFEGDEFKADEPALEYGGNAEDIVEARIEATQASLISMQKC